MKKNHIAVCFLIFLAVLVSTSGNVRADQPVPPTSVADNQPANSAQSAKPADMNETNAEMNLSPDKMVPQDLAPEDITAQETTLSLEVRMEDEDGLYIDITTNLPDETELMLTITDGEGSIYQEGKTLARVKTIVSGGTVVAGPFSRGDKPYPHGDYIIRIWTPNTQLQPSSVQEAIARRGGLFGPCIVDGRVFVEKTFVIIGRSSW